MKPSSIGEVMDLAKRARENGFKLNPLFVGPPGIGKSEIVQQWCEENGYQFIDFRAAYREAVDLTGFPQPREVTDENGNLRQQTLYFTPEFLPTKGKGVFFLDEINRGTTSVMNTFMQLLTDRCIDKYKLPDGWIIAAAVNPENEHNDVNTMDTALKDRFMICEVNYDKRAFVKYMERTEWDPAVINFIESGTWKYCKPEDLGNIAGIKYTSPRTFAMLNAVRKSDVPKALEVDLYESILGKNIGRAFYQFVTDDAPVLYSDLVKNESRALKKIESFAADTKNYKSGHLSITIKDIVDRNEISDELLAKVILALPADLGPSLIAELEYKRGIETNVLLYKLNKEFPKVRKYLQDVLNK